MNLCLLVVEALVQVLQMKLDDAHREFGRRQDASYAAVNIASGAHDVVADHMNVDNCGLVDDSNSQEYFDRDDAKEVGVDTKTCPDEGMKLRSRKRINYVRIFTGSYLVFAQADTQIIFLT